MRKEAHLQTPLHHADQQYLLLPPPRSALVPCDSSHLAKELSIPLVNNWSAVANNQGDVKLFRR